MLCCYCCCRCNVRSVYERFIKSLLHLFYATPKVTQAGFCLHVHATTINRFCARFRPSTHTHARTQHTSTFGGGFGYSQIKSLRVLYHRHYIMRTRAERRNERCVRSLYLSRFMRSNDFRYTKHRPKAHQRMKLFFYVCYNFFLLARFILMIILLLYVSLEFWLQINTIKWLVVLCSLCVAEISIAIYSEQQQQIYTHIKTIRK